MPVVTSYPTALPFFHKPGWNEDDGARFLKLDFEPGVSAPATFTASLADVGLHTLQGIIVDCSSNVAGTHIYFRGSTQHIYVPPHTQLQHRVLGSPAMLDLEVRNVLGEIVTIYFLNIPLDEIVWTDPSYDALSTALTLENSAALEGAHVFATSGGVLYTIQCLATTVSGYLMLFDAAAAPADGAVAPLQVWPVVAGGLVGYEFNNPGPLRFDTGLVAVFSTTGPLTKTASATAWLSARFVEA